MITEIVSQPRCPTCQGIHLAGLRCPLEKLPEDDSFVQYFQSLGYEVDWDFNPTGDWYELSKNGKMFCQIDKGHPLADIIEDIICWHLGKPTTSESDWTLRAPKSKALSEMYARVYERSGN